jgi:acetyltransferase-like isoleucine patch superfamily enzyme
VSIILTRDSVRWLARQGVRIHIPPYTEEWSIPESPDPMERHTNHSGDGVMPLGAYSYSHSFTRNVFRIGRYCSIGAGVFVYTSTHPTDRISTSPVFYRSRRYRSWGGASERLDTLVPFVPAADSVTVGNDVWIGGEVRIKEGVTIGDGAVIAYGSLVTKDVAPFNVVGGVPARVIRPRFEPGLVQAISDLAWWQYAISDLVGLEPETPGTFVRNLEKAIATGALHPMEEERFSLRDMLARR